MAVREWLRIADCWQCGASIELDLVVDYFQPATKPVPPVKSPASKPATQPDEAPVKPAPATASAKARKPLPWVKAATDRAAPLPIPLPLRPREVLQPVARHLRELWKNGFSDLPAWLVSLLVHLLLMMILGFLTISPPAEDDTIELALNMSAADEIGTELGEDSPPDATEFERPGLPSRRETPALPASLAGHQEIEELYALGDRRAQESLSRDELLRVLSTPQAGRMFEGRDPRVRGQILEQEGGTTATEMAVARGLRWLARHQSSNGSWSLDSFQWAGDCDGECSGTGDFSDMGGTSLALLPFLGAGQTHLSGIYQREVVSGLAWIIAQQRADGDLRGSGVGRMYAHGQATIVLCEAYALSRDENLRLPAQLAVDFIVDAQHREGGWRYSPGERGDTSVLGWQLMALHSARLAGLDVPLETLAMANHFLDRVQKDDEGGLYAYQRHRHATPTMTAEALLCRQYLGWGPNHPGLYAGLAYLLEEHPPNAYDVNVYYWYYASQVFHHVGGEPWRLWNERMRNILLDMQETQGHAAGSWAPEGGADGTQDTRAGGRIYMTSLAICTLEVYYRHLPLFRALSL